MSATNYFFKQDEVIDQQFTVKSFFAINDYAQTYRVRNTNFEAKVLKLFLTDAEDELAVLERLDNPNVLKLDEVGEVTVNNTAFRYAVLDFVNGDSLFDRTERKEPLSFIGAYNVFLGIVSGLIYLRRLHPVVYHNRILPKNIILNLASNAMTPVLANFSFSSGNNIQYAADELFFVPPEMFRDEPHPSSDLYTAGAIYYYLLHGYAPFSKDMSQESLQSIPFKDALLQKKQEPVDFHLELYDSTRYIITKAMHPDPAQRYQDPAEIRKDLYKDPRASSFKELLASLKV
ncbi:MAG: hypothetical protein Q4G44_01530 [Alcaligenaceae bacterium]|nr:hypothetical protein [Alcaligenaceae bacterium]